MQQTPALAGVCAVGFGVASEALGEEAGWREAGLLALELRLALGWFGVVPNCSF